MTDPIDPLTGLTYSEVERRQKERRDANLRAALGLGPLLKRENTTSKRKLVCFRAVDPYGQGVALSWGPLTAWKGDKLPYTARAYGPPLPYEDEDDSFLVVGEFPTAHYYTLTAIACDSVAVQRAARGIAYIPLVDGEGQPGLFLPD